MKIFIVSHNIFLNTEQRKALQIKGSEVETLGVNTPIELISREETSEPGRELFCKYKLANGEGEPIYEHDGIYSISIHKKEQHKKLLSLKEGGSDGFCFAYNEIREGEEEPISVVHQVRISTTESLEESMFTDHLDQTSRK